MLSISRQKSDNDRPFTDLTTLSGRVASKEEIELRMSYIDESEVEVGGGGIAVKVTDFDEEVVRSGEVEERRITDV